MTTITIERALLEQALNALLLPCDRWNGKQFMIVKAAAESIQTALAAPATAPDELERLRKDAERYRWLAKYLVSDDESHDDALVAATTVAGLDYVIDAAMDGTP